MKVGATYHPEIYHPSDWDRDLTTAAETGLLVLRCGELSWTAFDPRRGAVEAEWIAQFLDAADLAGYEIIWCSPAGGPPATLFDKWPDLAGDLGRRPETFCLSHPGYRELCARYCTAIQEVLGNSLSIVGWDLDHGIKAGVCTCSRCEAAFHEWLEVRYETIDNLNSAWQTRSMGHIYDNWAQVPAPRGASGNWPPSLLLAFRRFRASLAKSFYLAQQVELKKAGAMVVGTSLCCAEHDDAFDRWEWRDASDVYCSLLPFDGSVNVEFELAAARGAMVGAKQLWVHEWSTVNRSDQAVAGGSASSIADILRHSAEVGAQYVLFRPLRQFAAGLEAEHRAIIAHDGAPTRLAEEVRAALAQIKAIEPNPIEIDALLLYSHDQDQAIKNRASKAAPFDYHEHLAADWYQGIVNVYGQVRIGGPTDISGFEKVIIAPFLQLRDEAALGAIRKAVEAGSTLITTLDFGRFDADNNVLPEPLLHVLSEWGAHVPDLELVWLPPAGWIRGRLSGTDVQGREFVGLSRGASPKQSRYEEIGLMENAKFSGCAALRTRVGQGQIFVAMTAFDSAGVSALVNLARSEL